METMRIDDALKSKQPVLPKGYKLEGLLEGQLMLAMVQPDPSQRPSIEEIKDKWMPKWFDSVKSEELSKKEPVAINVVLDSEAQ